MENKTDPTDSLPYLERRKLAELLDEELPKFLDIKGLTPLIEHHIRLTDSSPIKQCLRPENLKIQVVVNEQVEEILEQLVIDPSESSWSSPIVVVPNKDG